MTATTSDLLVWLVSANVAALVVLAAAFAVDRLASRWIAARWRIPLYLAVLVRALLPPSVATPVGVVPFEVHSAAGWRATVAEPTAAVDPSEGDPRSTSGTPSSGAASPLVWVYAAGVVLLAAWRVLGARGARAIVAASQPAGREFPDVRVHASAGPCVVGVVRPTIVVPRHLVDDREVLAAAVAHERAHCAARDPMLALMVVVLVIAAWPVVAAWCAAHRIRALIELGADADAVSGGDRAERIRYGRALVAAASRSQLRPIGVAFLGGAVGAQRLAERIEGLARPVRTRTAVQAGLSLALVGSLAFLAACTTSRPTAAEAVDAADPSARYPQVFWMVNVFDVDGRAPIDVGSEPLESGDGREVYVFETADVGSLFDRMQALPGSNLVSAPALLALPEQWASIEIGSSDKAGQRLVGVGVRLRAREVGAASLVADLETTRADGRSTSASALLRATQGLLVVDRSNDGRAASIVMVRPSVLRSQEDHPFQRAAPAGSAGSAGSEVPILSDVPVVEGVPVVDGVHRGSDEAPR